VLAGEETALGSGLFALRIQAAIPTTLDVSSCLWEDGEGRLEASSRLFTNATLFGNSFSPSGGFSYARDVELDVSGDGDRDILQLDHRAADSAIGRVYSVSCTFDVRGK
jgi:hypothetical protein